MGAALCVVALETDVIVSPIPCYPKSEGSAAQLFYQQANDLSSYGTLMGHFFTTIHIVSIDHHISRIGEAALNQ